VKAWAQVKVLSTATVAGPADADGSPTTIAHPYAGRCGTTGAEPAAGQSVVRFDPKDDASPAEFARVLDSDLQVLSSGS
jgi:hypothetical protein